MALFRYQFSDWCKAQVRSDRVLYAHCYLCLFSLVFLLRLFCFEKIMVYINIFIISKLVYILLNFLLNYFSVFPFTVAYVPLQLWLSVTYSKREGFPPSSTRQLLCPLFLWVALSVKWPTRYVKQTTQSYEGKKWIKFSISQHLKYSHNNHIFSWVTNDPFPDLIASFV